MHYSPAEMYALVNDVDAYPKFLPWCKSSRIVSQSGNEMIASVEIARGALNKTFTTKNTLQKPRKIQIALETNDLFERIGQRIWITTTNQLLSQHTRGVRQLFIGTGADRLDRFTGIEVVEIGTRQGFAVLGIHRMLLRQSAVRSTHC